MPAKHRYEPPFTLSPKVLHLVAEIGEQIGRYTVLADSRLSPRLRRANRVRTIHASLAIENNTLTLDQVTAVIAGRRILGDPREIQEVRNAFAAYEAMGAWHPASLVDLLAAHGTIMAGLADDAGRLRAGNVGVFRGDAVVHMAPPAKQVPRLVDDLLDWLARTDTHPLVASCVFHYELEFIHPFSDGNGRMGRLWQTLILRQWKPLLAYLPVETIVRDRQTTYYEVLGASDANANCTPFVEFLLEAIREALREAMATDQVFDQVTEQVKRVLAHLSDGPLGGAALMVALGLSHRPTFYQNYLNPALDGGWIERTQPDSPRSPTQQYRLTAKGRQWVGGT